jgi:ketosteroid isomerase-like protein
MKKSRIPADDFRAIMQANARFYSAFSSLDMPAMEDVWLDDHRCVCHFPGMKRLTGYEKIMKSFNLAVQEMNGATRRNWMEPTDIQVEFQTHEKATVFCNEQVYSICCEVIGGELRPESQMIQKLSATNGFKKVNGKWYLWYHQASALDDTCGALRLHRKEPSKIEALQVPKNCQTFDTSKVNGTDSCLFINCPKDLELLV